MASLGFRTMDEMIGRTDLLDGRRRRRPLEGARHRPVAACSRSPSCPRARRATASSRRRRCSTTTSTGSSSRRAAARSRPAGRSRSSARSRTPTAASAASSPRTSPSKHGLEGLAEDTIRVDFHGTAGQSFGGWLAHGVTFTLHGDANDYTGKGLSGGTLVVTPPPGVDVQVRGERRDRQRRALRRDRRQGVLPRPGRRALLRAQLGRDRGRRGRRRPRLRVHDRRPRGHPRADRAQLRRGHERRPGVRPRRARHVPRAREPDDARPARAADARPTRSRSTSSSPSTSSAPARRSPRRVLDDVGDAAVEVRQGLPGRLQARARRARPRRRTRACAVESVESASRDVRSREERAS